MQIGSYLLAVLTSGLILAEASPARAEDGPFPHELLSCGDGGDGDPTTFSFRADNRLAPLADARGKPLKPQNVPTDYDVHYAVHADGVDVCSVEYAWELGYGGDHPRLQPKYMDLSEWEEVRVENGWVAIDPASGRFKFAPENVVDDPRRMVHRKRIVLGNITMWHLVARGRLAFTAQEEETHAFQIYDATDPKNFRYAGYGSMGGYPMGMALAEKHAYVAGSGLLSVHNIEDPHDVKYVKTFHNGGSGSPFTMVADTKARRLYHCGRGGLMIYDIADEDDPVLIDILDGLQLAGLQVEENTVCGVKWRSREVEAKDKKGKPVKKKEAYTELVIAELAPGCHGYKLLGTCEITGGAGSHKGVMRHCLLKENTCFVINATGLHVVNVTDRGRPVVVKSLPELAPKPEYWEVGSGAHDMDARGNHLFVACGRSRGGWVNPRNTGLYRDHVDFEKQVVARKDEIAKGKTYSGGLRIYDISDPKTPKLVCHRDDELIGCDSVTNVAVGDGVLFVGARLVGVLAYDIADVANPKYLGKLSNMGEVEWARLIGDKIYAVSNGVYVIEPYPAEKAELLGFCFTKSWMFGHSVVMNPFPRWNPKRVLFARSGAWHRELTARDPRNPKILNYKPPPIGQGRWKDAYLYSPGKSALDIYVVAPDGGVGRIAHYPVKGPTTHLEIHGQYCYCVGLVRGKKQEMRYLHIFDVSDPAHAKLVGTHTAPTDAGGMESPDIYYKDGLLFLPGWFAGGNLCGGGWGNFPGIRVLDVRKPERPKMHCLIHHVPADISTNSICCVQSFYVSGDTLYQGDYWSGIHVTDIRDLSKKRKWTHLAAVKDPRLPWSCSSYCTSVHGYGRYLYTTHFGHVNIWEIPAPSDVPKGKITVRARAVPESKEPAKDKEAKK